MIASEKGLRRTVRKARNLHRVFLIYRRWAVDSFVIGCWAESAKSDRDAAMAEAREFKRRDAERARA
ncbi:hypothetical protein STPYR_10918 [uncultured Stenotrophomonas sp.]|uniref:Uncharacterized protein n=1 Tax=uncultured Stenotrophomonas sp. TaxID=165438 RepID=A0A1Y5Q123_9GAMM|nr:hypothetical protein STPYR_10918 [uncultured Stenotrophomonas sp.]